MQELPLWLEVLPVVEEPQLDPRQKRCHQFVVVVDVYGVDQSPPCHPTWQVAAPMPCGPGQVCHRCEAGVVADLRQSADHQIPVAKQRITGVPDNR